MKRKSLFLLLLLAICLPWAANAQTRDGATVTFETGNISALGAIGTVTNDADSQNFPWEVTTSKNHSSNGSYCMKSTNNGSGNNDANTKSAIEVSVNFSGAGTVSFYCWASCESASNYWDYGVFYIDGTQQDRFLSVSDWVNKSYDITTAGTHILKWSFERDGSGGNNDNCFYVDDITIDIPSCAKPTDLTATLVPSDGTKANLSWKENGSATNWVLQYGTNSDFTSGTYTQVSDDFTTSGTTIKKALSGLTGDTKYYARVKSDCGGGDQSDWSNTIEFTPTAALFIGNGTSTTSYFPLYGNYNYSYDQMIYTATQLRGVGIDTDGTITKIAFNSSASNSNPRETVIYMGHTTKTSFSNGNDFVAFADLTKVYDYTNHATWSIIAGWNEFELDTPFEYDGTSNLVIAMYCHGAFKSTSFYYTSATDQALYARDDNKDPNPSTYDGNWGDYSGSKAKGSELPNLKMYFELTPAGDYITRIGSKADWESFCTAVNSGHDYSGETVKLTANITEAVNTMAGTSSNRFKGTFDGQGNTLTVALNSSSQFCAPFSCVENATIQNLKVAGTITTSNNLAGGIIGDANLGFTITNCLCSVSIISTGTSTDQGGLVGHAMKNTTGTGYITGCVFNGELHNNAGAGMVGWVEWHTYSPVVKSKVIFEDCLFAPAVLENVSGYTYSRGRENNSNDYSVTNCYYTQAHGTAQGTQCYSITGDTDVTVAMNGTASSTYNVSGIDFYNAGFTFSNTIYAASGDLVSLSLGYTGSGILGGYLASNNGSIAGTSNPYTLTMPANNTVISAQTTSPIYEIYNDNDWNTFAQVVRGGHSYNGETVHLLGNISITSQDNQAGAANNFFRGTFEGHGDTITVNMTATGDCCAPFYGIKSATFNDLIVTGSITSAYTRIAGISSNIEEEKNGGDCTFTNCISSVNFNSTKTDGSVECGGFIGHSGSYTDPVFVGCAFTGSITAIGGDCAGFIGFHISHTGWAENYIITSHFTNCICAPSSINITSNDHGTFVSGYNTGDNINTSLKTDFTNCYYNDVAANLSTKQGKRAYTVTGESPVTVAMVGTPTQQYSVSHIDVYSQGIVLDGNIYAGSGETVSLAFSGSTTGGYQSDHGTLTASGANYTLTMDAYDTQISEDPCPVLTLTVSNITNSGATVSWDKLATQITGGITYNYTWVEHGGSPDWTLHGGMSAFDNYTNTNAPCAFAYDLAPETKYDFYVRREKGTNEYCDAVIVSFTTLSNCSAPAELSATATASTATLSWSGAQDSYNVKYRKVITASADVNDTYGFEGNTLQGWTPIDNDGDGNAWMVSSTPHTGSYCARSYYTPNGSGYNANNWLISPQTTLGGVISFYAKQYGSDERFQVFVSTTGTNISDFTAISEVINPSETYQQYTYSLSGYSGQGYIAIVHTSTTAYAWYVYIDDINITASIAGEYGEWNTNNTNVTSPLPVNGLTPNTTYEWQVQGVNCDGNNTNTDWTSNTFATPEGYIKHINAYSGDGGYYLIASPIGTVSPANVTNMTSNNTYDLYYFDQSQTLEWVNYKSGENQINANFGNLTAGKGFLYANSQSVDLIFTGAAYTGSGQVTLALNSSDPQFEGMNLVGNPFADTAYISNNHSFYRMASGGAEIEPTLVTGAIAPMEGVFVKAASDGETMTFTTTNPNAKIANLALNLTKGNGFVDRAIVCFSETSQLPKFQLKKNSTKVYIPKEGKDYAVVSSEEMGTMPVNFKAENEGSYTLSFTSEEVSFAYLHLIDNLTGIETDLLATPSYSFEARTTDYESRFKLVFATGNNSNDNFAFYSNGSFVINNEGEATLQVIDMNGRILKSESINGCAIVNVNAAQGIYMLRLVNGDNVKVQKVVVR